MKTKADKHREAGTLDAFRRRQAASRAGTRRYQERMAKEAEERAAGPTDEEIRMAMVMTPHLSDDDDYEHWIRMGRAVLALINR